MTDSLRALDKLLKSLCSWLSTNSERYNFEIYKFTGDGWILLFPQDLVEGRTLLKFLVNLSRYYDRLYHDLIAENLDEAPESTGLTFGMEMGRVRRVDLSDQIEYVGRALNIACRLQNAVKDKGPAADYRVLMSRRVYNTYLQEVQGYTFFNATRTLRNISGGEDYMCKKLNLSSKLG